jgi:hypothetical protein
MTAYRPPQDCPVCHHRLDVTQLGCAQCGTGLTGRFEPCEFCGLDDGDRDLLRVFLRSRGNMKEFQRHLGVSYPTARSRFDELLARLDLADGGGERPTTREPAASEDDEIDQIDHDDVRGADDPDLDDDIDAEDDDERLELLRSLAHGDVTIDDARSRLTTGRNQKDTVRPPD